MVVECIGLPGSGKTYFLRSVEEELRKRGIPCVNAGERSMHSVLWKAGKKVLHRTIFLDRNARELRDRMRKILADQAGGSLEGSRVGGSRAGGGRSGREDLRAGGSVSGREALRVGGSRSGWEDLRAGGSRQESRAFPLRSRYGINSDERFTIESAAIFAAVYHLMEKSEKVYLFDEGLVHTLVKFCAEFHLPDQVFLEIAAACGPYDEITRIVVHNGISVDDCVKSIRKRDRHICAFDELPEDLLRELLGEYSRLNACYAAHYPVLSVLRADDDGEKVRQICGGIFRKRTGRKRFRRR